MSKLAEFFQATHTQMGLVFYPTHFMFAAFPSLALARDAGARLIECGLGKNEIHVASDTDVLEFFKEFRSEKSLWSKFVRGLGLIDEIRFCELDIERARAGACFVAIHCRTEQDAQRIKREVDEFSVIGMQWYRSFTIHCSLLRKDKPILSPGRPGHPQLAKLPEWPARTIAVLCTTDEGPHAIPVAAPVRAGDQRILISLERTRASLARLRENPQVALAILGGNDVAFTALGRARIVQESMADALDFVAVEIDVEKIDDHRSQGAAVASGVRVQFVGAADVSLQKRIDVLQQLSEQKA
jgi:Pyridoxamine 5'-phosphate oxidase